MTARKLRAVPDGDQQPSTKRAPAKRAPRKAPPKTVAKAAAAGDRRGLLVAMQARIAAAIDDPKTHPRDLAQLARRQLEIAEDIAAIDATSGRKTARRRTAVVAETDAETWDQSAI
jgi:hypothetical protein